MQRIQVDSTSIASLGYEAETRTLEIEFRDSLPKTPIGKVLRRVLAEEERGRRG